MNQHADGIIVAIDGPAASGKSSTARAVASRLAYYHLDSGAFYRAVTLAALERGIPTAEWPYLSPEQLDGFRIEAAPAADTYELSIDGRPVGGRIRSPEVNANVSRMAAVPTVRAWLMDALRRAGHRGKLVADGRDIGSVVFPDAELKIFLVCQPEVRARRRLLQDGPGEPDPAEIRAEAERLAERDRQDRERVTAPLLQAPDAIVLDTTRLDFDTQVDTITNLAIQRIRA